MSLSKAEEKATALLVKQLLDLSSQLIVFIEKANKPTVEDEDEYEEDNGEEYEEEEEEEEAAKPKRRSKKRAKKAAITLKEVRAKMREYREAFGAAEGRKVMKNYGVTNMNDLAEEDYKKIVEQMTEDLTSY